VCKTTKYLENTRAPVWGALMTLVAESVTAIVIVIVTVTVMWV